MWETVESDIEGTQRASQEEEIGGRTGIKGKKKRKEKHKAQRDSGFRSVGGMEEVK